MLSKKVGNPIRILGVVFATLLLLDNRKFPAGLMVVLGGFVLGPIVQRLAFGAFCLGASAIYLVNDVLDVESDRAHPSKRRRPVASGDVPVPAASSAASL